MLLVSCICGFFIGILIGYFIAPSNSEDIQNKSEEVDDFFDKPLEFNYNEELPSNN